MKSLRLMGVVSLFLSACFSQNCEGQEQDRDKMQGVWRFDKMVDRGKSAPPSETNNMTAVIQGDKLEIWHAGNSSPSRELSLRLNPEGCPSEFDLITELGSFPGIYRFIEENSLILAFDMAREHRPTKFVSDGTNTVMLIIPKRATAK